MKIDAFMLARSAADGGGTPPSGSSAAPSAPPSGLGISKPGGPPGAAPAGASSTPGSDAPPPWAAALIAKVDSLEASNKKLAADKGAAEQAKQTLEEQVSSLRKGQEEMATRANEDRIRGALGDTLSGYTFASATHKDHGMVIFKAAHKLEVVNGEVIATGADGKPQHLANAFSAWAKTDGVHYLASAAQPGAGAPKGAVPEGQQAKDPMEMSPEEFQALMKAGIKGKLTDSPYSPEVSIRKKTNRWEALRERDIGLAMRYGQGQNGPGGR